MSSPRTRKLTSVIVFICAWLVAASLGLSAWTFVRQSQADTIRAADKKAQSITQVSQCFQQVRNAPQGFLILGLLDDLATNSIKANRQALLAQPNSPLSKTRQASINRLVPPRRALRAYIKAQEKKVPTLKSCKAVAAKLGVDPSKLNR